MRISNFATTTQVHVCLIQSLMIMRPTFCLFFFFFLNKGYSLSLQSLVWSHSMEDKEGKIVSTHVFFRVCVCPQILCQLYSIFCDELVGLGKVISGPNLFCLILGLVPFIIAVLGVGSCTLVSIAISSVGGGVLWILLQSSGSGFFNIFQNQTRLWGFFLL